MPAIMIHHLWEKGNPEFPYRLGAITPDQLDQLITNDRHIISADDWSDRFSLNISWKCLSFDDRLISSRLAIPVLKKHNLKAFFFCPTIDVMELEKERY